MSIGRIVRDYPPGLTATEHLQRFTLALVIILQELEGNDDHLVLVTRETLQILGEEVTNILDCPEEVHERLLYEMVASMHTHMDNIDVPEFNEGQSVQDMVAQIAEHFLCDMDSIVVQLELEKMGLFTDTSILSWSDLEPAIEDDEDGDQ